MTEEDNMGTDICIRAMTAADVESAASFAKTEWGDRHPYLRFYLSHPRCRPLVAERDGAGIRRTAAGVTDGRES